MDKNNSLTSICIEYSLYLWAISIPLSKTLSTISFVSTIFFSLTHQISLWIFKNSSFPRHSNSLLQLWTSDPLHRSIFIFLIYCLLSFFWGSHPYENFRGFNKYMKDFLIFYVIIDVGIRNPSISIKLVFSLLLGGLLTSFNGLAQMINGIDLIHYHSFEGRINSTFNTAPFFSSYLSLIIPLSFLYILRVSNRWRIFYFSTFFFLTLIFLFTFTRGTFISLLLATSILIWFHRRLDIIQKILAAVVVVIIIFCFDLANGRKIFQTLGHPIQNISLQERIFLWNISKEMIVKKPLLGHGMNSYSKIHTNFFPPSIQQMPTGMEYLYLAYPHSSYLKIWIEIGLIGLILYLSVFYHLFRTSILCQKELPSRERHKRISFYLASLLSFLIASFLGEFLISVQTRATFWTISGLLYVELLPALFASHLKASEARQEKDAVGLPIVVPQTSYEPHVQFFQASKTPPTDLPQR